MRKIIAAMFLLITINLFAYPDDDLINAAKNFDYDAIGSALLNGADIDAKDSGGRTALIIVCSLNTPGYSFNKKYTIIRLLLSNGANVNARDNDGRTAVISLFSNPDNIRNFPAHKLLKINRLLIAKGADIDAKDKKEKTANNYYTEFSAQTVKIEQLKSEEVKEKGLFEMSEEESKTERSFNQKRKIIEQNMDPSYIGVYPFEYNSSNEDKIKCNQHFEADINPQMRVFSKGAGDNYNYFINFTPRVTLRMLRDYSAPVKTSSFMPRGTWYMWWNSLNNALPSQINFLYFSLMISHHSNGQSGNFYTSNGRVNTESGNFSTNFIEAAASAVTFKKIRIEASYQWHPGFNREEELKGQYELSRVFLKTKLFFLEDCLRISGSVSYATSGRKYIQSPEAADSRHPAIKGKRAKISDNFNYQAQVHFLPKYFFPDIEDLTVFCKYDYGYDYYNIHFQERLNQLQFGIAFLAE
ncbi:MAG: ankyrin repeat domain-containing protein [Spirochaetota bacterium]